MSVPDNYLEDVTQQAVWDVSSAKGGTGAADLIDGREDTFWQSDHIAPHLITMSFSRVTYVAKVDLLLNYLLDDSYTPRVVQIRAGTHRNSLSIVGEYRLHNPMGWQTLELDPVAFMFRYLRKYDPQWLVHFHDNDVLKRLHQNPRYSFGTIPLMAHGDTPAGEMDIGDTVFATITPRATDEPAGSNLTDPQGPVLETRVNSSPRTATLRVRDRNLAVDHGSPATGPRHERRSEGSLSSASRLFSWFRAFDGGRSRRHTTDVSTQAAPRTSVPVPVPTVEPTTPQGSPSTLTSDAGAGVFRLPRILGGPASGSSHNNTPGGSSYASAAPQPSAASPVPWVALVASDWLTYSVPLQQLLLNGAAEKTEFDPEICRELAQLYFPCFVVQVVIIQNYQNGQDSHVRQVRVRALKWRRPEPKLDWKLVSEAATAAEAEAMTDSAPGNDDGHLTVGDLLPTNDENAGDPSSTTVAVP